MKKTHTETIKTSLKKGLVIRMDKHNPNETLLTEMYSNTKMALENINSVLPKVKSKFMVSELTAQMESYGNMAKRTSELMHQRSIEPKEPNVMAKTMAKFGINMNTLIDATDSHIADRMAKGCDMGADSLSEAYTKHGIHCDSQITDLCNEIIDFERKTSKNIEEKFSQKK